MFSIHITRSSRSSHRKTDFHVALRTSFRRQWAVFPLLLIGNSGCFYIYKSTYTAPADGRGRVVWRRGDLRLETSGRILTKMCAAEIVSRSKGKLLLANSKIDWIEGDLGNYSINCTFGRCGNGFYIPYYLYDSTITNLAEMNRRYNEMERYPVFYSPLMVSQKYRVRTLTPTSDNGQFNYWEVIFGLFPEPSNSYIGFYRLFFRIGLPLAMVWPGFGAIYGFYSGDGTGLVTDESINNMNIYNDLARTPGNSCSYENALGSNSQ